MPIIQVDKKQSKAQIKAAIGKRFLAMTSLEDPAI
jgi:hypothetical protein